MTPVGMGDFVTPRRVLAVVGIDSSPAQKLVRAAKAEGLVIDATHGRRTRSVIVLDTGHLVLSILNTETIAGRLGVSP